MATHAHAVGLVIDYFEIAKKPDDWLGIGHRVVHGGAHFSAPLKVTPETLRELTALIPLGAAAPAAQCGGDPSIDGRGCRTCRRSPASTPRSMPPSRRSPPALRCPRNLAGGIAALWISRPVLRSHSPCAAFDRGRRAEAPDRRASRQRRKHGGDPRRDVRRDHHGLLHPRRPGDGDARRRHRSRRAAAPAARRDDARRAGAPALSRERGQRRLRPHRRHEDAAGERRPQGETGNRALLLSHRNASWGRWRRRSADSMPWSSLAASARTRPASAHRSARTRRGSACSWMTRRTKAADRAFPSPDRGSRPGSCRPTRS